MLHQIMVTLSAAWPIILAFLAILAVMGVADILNRKRYKETDHD